MIKKLKKKFLNEGYKINIKQILAKNEFRSHKRTDTVKNSLAASNVTVTSRKHFEYLYYSNK